MRQKACVDGGPGNSREPKMINWKHLAGGAAVSAIALSFAGVAEAQITTSSVRGQITDAGGAAVTGATVTVLDTRTGNVKTAVTDGNGNYALRALRVGGPYTITATSADGEGGIGNVYLQVNEAFPGNFRIKETRTLETVTVVGEAGAGGLDLGPRSTFDLETIESLPTISRDIRDIARLDPLVTVDATNGGAISIAGTNNRYNSLTIDGIKFNDLFGLNANGFPSQRSPISIDALQSFHSPQRRIIYLQ